MQAPDDMTRQDADPADPQNSPLGYAITEADRHTLIMVREALQTRRLKLAYQPVVMSADAGRIAFYEGFIRVLDPVGRVIPARDFMGAVESHEIGRMIDCATLEMGLATLIRHPELRLSVNMSARSIGYGRWMRILRQGLKTAPLVGERLILEITESSAMLVPELVISFMDELRREGIAFALDDFGAGFTALRHLRDFCFDVVKIDGEFCRGVEADPDNQALVRAMVAIARQFDMLVVAEGVETGASANVLRDLGADCLQGYAFGLPTVKPDFLVDRVARAMRG